MTYRYSGEGDPEVGWEALPGEGILITAREIRREHTGLHAVIGIFYKNTILAYDAFNIGRNEDRVRLSRSAHRALGQVMQTACPLETLKNHLDRLCLWVTQSWEADRFQIEEFDPSAEVLPPERVVTPYVMQGGGTVFFGEPGAGKSYLAHLMGLMIVNGISDFWPVEARPVLYVNLERHKDTFAWREKNLARILGIRGRTALAYLHARGHGLAAVAPKIREFTRRNRDAVIVMDSVSRAQMGKMVDDTTAVRWIDTMNATCETWYAVGHSPRATNEHMFGSIMYDAGIDIGVQVLAEQQQNVVGIALTITKGNDTAKGRSEYLAYEFDKDAIVGVRRVSAHEFPELAGSRKMTRLAQVKEYVARAGEATASQTAAELGLPRPDVANFFSRSGLFTMTRRAGNQVYYGVKAQAWEV